ncbi:hypothetical protein [Streptomyces sp. NPDC050856]|uniref:hypothetical protein n=1 Tax=unclassified Streptomyces TaxID=2593676 RepID=UPI0033EDEC41
MSDSAKDETANDEPVKVVGTRPQDEVDAETKQMSSQILDLIAVKGKTSQGGPGVMSCEGKDRDRFFIMNHPWSLTASTDEELARAMARLKEELPRHGWKIVRYGPDTSPSKNLELVADNDERKFGLNIAFWKQDRGGDKNPPSLIVNVVSGCYQVPEGQTVEHY